jgi:hypothetical protein
MAGKLLLTITNEEKPRDYIDLFGVKYPVLGEEQLGIEERAAMKRDYRRLEKLDDPKAADMAPHEIEQGRKALRAMVKTIMPTLPDEVLHSERLTEGLCFQITRAFFTSRALTQTEGKAEETAQG